jgi:hypothetical protein
MNGDDSEKHSWLIAERRHNSDMSDTLVLILEQNRQIAEHIDELRAWQKDHDEKSCDLLKISGELQALVAYQRWMRTTQRIIMWMGAAIIGIVMFYHTLSNELSKFTKP